MQSVRSACVQRRERQNDEIHDFFDRGAIEQPAHQRMLDKKFEPPTCRVINGRCGERDKKVQENAEDVCSCASVEGLPPQQTSSNGQWNLPSKQNAGLCEVENS